MPLDFDPKALELFLASSLQKITSADPDVLATYVLALLKKDKSADELRENCLKELEDFLEGETAGFVNDMFDAIESRRYLKAASRANGSPKHAASVPSEIVSAGRGRHHDSDNDSEDENDRHHRRRGRSADRGFTEHERDSKRRRSEEDYRRDDRDPRRDMSPGRGVTRGGIGYDRRGGWNERDGGRFREDRRFYEERGGGRPRDDRFREDRFRDRRADEYDPEAALAQVEREGKGGMLPRGKGGFDGKGGKGWGRMDFRPPPMGYMMEREWMGKGEFWGKGGKGMMGGKGGKMKVGGKGGLEMEGPARDNPTAICIREVPKELFNQHKMRSHFAKFGKIVEIYCSEQKKAIFVTFSKNASAQKALDAPEAVCGNRFVTVDWARKQTHVEEPDKEEEEEEAKEAAQADPAYKSKAQQAFEEKKARAAEKQQLIAKQIEHQKALVAQMEGMKNLTAVEKLEMIRSLTKNMEEQKGQLVKQAPKPAPAEPPKSAPEAGAEGEINEGEEAELAKLQQEFKQLEEKVTMAGINVDSPAKKPQGKGGGRKGGRGWNNLDLRPRALKVNGVGEGVDEGALSSHFGAGAVEAIEVGGDGSAVVKFKTRRGAEIALKSKGDMNGSRLTMGWHTEVAPKVEEAGKEAEAGKAEDADL